MQLRHIFGAAAGLFLAATANQLHAQTVTTVVNNGPSAELYDMVILGDGYRSTEQTRFNQDVADIVAYFQNQASVYPYGEYFQCYNVHSVFRASVESGADDPCANPPVTRNTVYDAEYCWGGTQRCLYIRNTAQAATDAALAPDTDGRVIVLVNDTQYGGCASTYAVSYNGTSMEEVNCHEWGHSFGLLADEYDYGTSGPYVGGEPSDINCTASTTGNAKWPLWVGATGQYGTVGAYPGACYYPPTPLPTLYRPELNCEMRELSRRFCTICREQMIKRFHQEVDMINNPFRSPGGSVAQHSTVIFGFANRISNRPHTIQWRIDGGSFFTGTTSFYWNVGAATVGNHTITVRLTDTSPDVRNDPGNLLRHEFSWTVNVTSGSLLPSCSVEEVLPSTLDGVEGNSSTAFPFARTGEMRLMMAYGPTALGVSGPTRFDGIAFRPNGGTASLAAASYRLQAYVSTSRNPATNLSRTFESNHGSDRALLFNGTVATAARTLGTSPSEFVLEIPFSRPFEWDPSYGPLLVDLRLISSSGIAASAWDGPISNGDDIGRIAHQSDYTATSADFPATGTQNFALTMSLCEECEVGPDAYTDVEAGSSSGYPFNIGPNRTLMAYDRSLFESDFAGRHRITKIAFRPDNGNAMAAFSLGMTVDMSTGVTAANALSSTFASNHGADKTRVWNGRLDVPAQPASSNPAGFGVEIPLQTPFEYDPAAGPLVVEFIVTQGSGSPGTNFDGPFNTGELIGRVFTGSPTATTGGAAQNFGLVMCVVSEPCPTLPAAQDRAFGNATSAFPWASAGPMRAMYAYDETSVATTKPITIQHLRWRPTSGTTSIGPVSYDVRIDMSTSALASASAITTTFATNHGSNVSTVFNGTVSIPYTALSANPRDFPLSIKLDAPFYWNPASGPLIVDIRSNGIIGGANSAQFDGFNGPATYRVVHQSNRNATVADFGPQSFGLTISLCGEDCNGTAVNYGAACAGSAGTSINSTLGLPQIPNPTFGFRLRNAPASQPAALWLGFAQTSIDLTGLGANNCFLLNSLNLASVTTATNGSGIATYNAPIPNDPLLNGGIFYSQWVAIDPGAPRPLPVITSDGQRITLCF
ncbi:MAG: hypothetical protein JNM84_27430 [Planctomycetes bacterium]|nr:hypothetical protein [Planctomycetota bacterium]